MKTTRLFYSLVWLVIGHNYLIKRASNLDGASGLKQFFMFGIEWIYEMQKHAKPYIRA